MVKHSTEHLLRMCELGEQAHKEMSQTECVSLHPNEVYECFAMVYEYMKGLAENVQALEEKIKKMEKPFYPNEHLFR